MHAWEPILFNSTKIIANFFSEFPKKRWKQNCALTAHNYCELLLFKFEVVVYWNDYLELSFEQCFLVRNFLCFKQYMLTQFIVMVWDHRHFCNCSEHIVGW